MLAQERARGGFQGHSVHRDTLLSRAFTGD